MSIIWDILIPYRTTLVEHEQETPFWYFENEYKYVLPHVQQKHLYLGMRYFTWAKNLSIYFFDILSEGFLTSLKIKKKNNVYATILNQNQTVK